MPELQLVQEPPVPDNGIRPEPAPPPTIGELCASRIAKKKQCEDASRAEKAYRAELEEIDIQIINALEKQGTTLARANGFTMSITEEIVPNEINWDATWDYIKNNDAFYLVQRRLNATAWRELIANDPTATFAEQFPKKSLSVRKA